MELRDFVAKTLSAILDGVEDAIRNAPKDRAGKIAPVIEGEEDWGKAPLPIEFDVAVTEADKVALRCYHLKLAAKNRRPGSVAL
jgi:hypothetical protein